MRHEDNVAGGDPSRALLVHAALKADYPILEQQVGQQLTIAASPLGLQPISGTAQRGWKMRTQDGRWSAVMMPDFYSLETTSYFDWPDFSARISKLTRAIADAAPPAIEARVGLRFIDRITHPDVATASDWRGWISPEFLGPLNHDAIGSSVTGSQQMFQLDDGSGHLLILRHGAITEADGDATPIYAFDQDWYVQRGRGFEPDSVMTVVEELHTLALQTFQAAISDKLYAYLLDES